MEAFNPVLLKRYEEMLQNYPQSKIFGPLAHMYRIIKKYQKAEQVCKSGIQYHPEYAVGYITLAKIYLDQHKRDQALEAIKKAKKISPDDYQIYEVLAKIYTAQKDLDKTLMAYKMIHFIRPWDQDVKKQVQHLEKILSLQKNQIITSSTREQVKKARSLGQVKQAQQIETLENILNHIDKIISQRQLMKV